MQLEQALEMYRPIQMQETQERQRVYTIVDLESLSASALYTGDSGSFGSGFGPASNLGLGLGIAREMPEAEYLIERARKDNDLPSHLNYEYLVPGKKTDLGKQKFINLANLHIDLED